MLTEPQRGFIDRAWVARLATADARGMPHLVPVCFVVEGMSLYITVDEKPKRVDIPLKRIRNIQENPAVAVTVDRWDEDWGKLAWVMLRGTAEVLEGGEEHTRAQALLRAKYPQYRSMAIEALPVIAMRITRVLGWGRMEEIEPTASL